MRYGSATRRNFKVRWGINGKRVNDHHIIPNQWRNHVVVKKANYDVHASYNLMLMPTRQGMNELSVNSDRLIHELGHSKYNKYVKFMLDVMSEDDIWIFRDFLKKNCRVNEDNIPWN